MNSFSTRTYKSKPALALLAGVLALGMLCPLAARGQGIADFKGVIGPTEKESTPYYPPPVRPRAGSPNVVYIVLDDVGFADLGCYGSEIKTPNIDALALGGLRYNNFHTRAICSPTRAALLTGRNSHSVGLRTVANFRNGFPNGQGYITPAATTLAEVLRPAGYSTFAVGKWHLVPPEDTSPSGPFDHWPTQRGFERYYGFLDGLTDQYHPELVQDNTRIAPPNRPGYHLSADLVDRSVQYIQDQQALTPDKPFFLYLALGAAHAPHQAPEAYVRKYLPVFEKGWDKTRAERLARQKQLGIVPANTELAAPNEGIKAWDSLSPDEQKLFVRYQAAFAGFLDHADEQVGRLIAHLRKTGQLDNTIVVLLSDNGASQEGGFEGFVNEVAGYGGAQVPLAEKLKRLEDIGTERATSNYPLGWAAAGNTPFPRYKQNVHGGGVNDPLIVHWPRGIAARGAVRNQFVDVIDITPTILDLAGIDPPKVYHDVAQKPLDGASIARSFTDPQAPAARSVQYFEQGGNRALWNDGWKAVTFHRPGTDFEQDRWELYNLSEDFSESKDLAARNPVKLKQLQDLWWVEAKKYGVLPLDGRSFQQVGRLYRTRPGSLTNRASYRFYPGQEHLPSAAAPDIIDRSFSIAAEVERPDARGEGVLIAQGDEDGGYSFFLKDGRLHFDHNDFGRHTLLSSPGPVPVGRSTLRYQFTRTAPFRGTAALFVDDKQVAEMEVSRTPGFLFAWEGLDVGRDSLRPASPAYARLGEFALPTGVLKGVVFDLSALPPNTTAANP